MPVKIGRHIIQHGREPLIRPHERPHYRGVTPFAIGSYDVLKFPKFIQAIFKSFRCGFSCCLVEKDFQFQIRYQMQYQIKSDTAI
jgi:hypothetical protein